MTMTVPPHVPDSIGPEPQNHGMGVSSLLEKIVDGAITGLGIPPAPTGFHPFDLTFDGGLLPGELVLLGGQPAVGQDTVRTAMGSIRGPRQAARGVCLLRTRRTFAARPPVVPGVGTYRA